MTTTGVLAVAILSVLLGISLLAVFFLLRQVLIWQSNRFRLEMQRSSENKEASQTYTDLKAVEEASSYTTLGSTVEESPYQVLPCYK